ncbi:MAG: PilN domain-containing protein [Pseudomonadota bacterium]
MFEPIVNPVRRFFKWWGSELKSCLPRTLRRLFDRKYSQLIVEFLDRQAVIRRTEPAGNTSSSGSTGQGSQVLGEIPLTNPSDLDRSREVLRECLDGVRLDPQGIVLRLPKSQVLRRTLDLPAAALENLRDVLSFEMDRHTPFKAEEVYFDHRILSRRDDRLSVELVMVPRVSAEKVVRLACDWGLKPSRVGVEGEAPASFRLYPDVSSGSRPRLASALTVALALVAIGLFAAAFYLPLEGKRQHLALLQSELAAAQKKAQKAQTVREEVEQRLASGAFLVERKKNRPPISQVMAEVTELLPDHTWVLQFGWREGRLVLAGYSGKATELIGLLERSALLDEVQFNSPVTADPRIGLDRFNLTATVADTPES